MFIVVYLERELYSVSMMDVAWKFLNARKRCLVRLWMTDKRIVGANFLVDDIIIITNIIKTRNNGHDTAWTNPANMTQRGMYRLTWPRPVKYKIVPLRSDNIGQATDDLTK